MRFVSTKAFTESTLFCLLMLRTLPALANISVPRLFSSGMVVQREMPIRVWGWGAPGEEVRVDFAGQSRRSTTNGQGRWEIELSSISAAGPFDMQITGQSQIILKNVLVGEVWLCSGQSNMRFAVKYAYDAKREIAAADHPQLRLFGIGTSVSTKALDDLAPPPQADLESQAKAYDREDQLRAGLRWAPASPETVPDFSAYCYFFGRDLHRALGVPVGVIMAARGGTRIEAWTSEGSLRAFSPELVAALDDIDALSPQQLEQRATQAAQEHQALRRARMETLLKSGDDATRFITQWSRLDYDDRDWPEVFEPATQFENGLADYDGVLFLRKKFFLPETIANRRHAVMSVGVVDDGDTVWVNGQKVGGLSDAPSAYRRYQLHYKVLQPGQENVILMKIQDTAGDGGLRSLVPELALSFADRTVNLSGPWKMNWVKKIPALPPAPWNLVNQPSVLFNAMIAPIRHFRLRGVLWGQGAGNGDNRLLYPKLFRNWIGDWREQFGAPDLAIIWVQEHASGLPRPLPFDSAMAVIREAHAADPKLPRTGAAFIDDLNDPEEVHFTKKREAAGRMLQQALGFVYNRTAVRSGPVFRSFKIRGSKIVVTFDTFGSRLRGQDIDAQLTDVPDGFAIAGVDRQFVWARAKIVSATEVEVSSPLVKAPQAVRYLWTANPGPAPLANELGFPAGSFRTDAWTFAGAKVLPQTTAHWDSVRQRYATP